jgi:hypothetical protein
MNIEHENSNKVEKIAKIYNKVKKEPKIRIKRSKKTVKDYNRAKRVKT